MYNRLRSAVHYLAQQGPRIAFFRARYSLARRTGMLARRFPPFRWEDRPLKYWVSDDAPHQPAAYRRYRAELGVHFFFGPGRAPTIEREWQPGAIDEADRIRGGTFTYFSAERADLGDPPDWLLNPFTQRHADIRPWTQRSDFESQIGDIKYIWEPSRFGWVYTLSRAYAATGDDDYAACFWRFFESWCAANPPQCGPNWQCGQEVAMRTMACIWGLYTFWASPHTTDTRVVALVAMVAASADRIAGNIAFARSLRSNHTISEAAGLYSVGVLFPELQQAKRWRRMGKRILDGECLDQFYADGSYIQHSPNYQRLALQTYTWVLRLAELNRDEFSSTLRSTLERSGHFLWNLQDTATGRVPNYGCNDGALALPLNSCDYLDYRPTLNALHFALRKRPLYDPGPWDEDLRWLFGGEEATSPEREVATNRQSMHAADGGYFTLRGSESWAMVRCHTYRDRPVQADMLHMDLWWRGMNILRDSGTFRYNCELPWMDHFQSTAAHNTVVVDGESQMRHTGRFMWLNWTRSSVRYHQKLSDGRIDYWEGQHTSYLRRPGTIVHRRAIVRLGDSFWVVVDDMLGAGSHSLDLYWQVIDVPGTLSDGVARFETPNGVFSVTSVSLPASAKLSLERGRGEPAPCGWESLTYGVRTPAPTIVAAYQGRVPARFVTVIALVSAGAAVVESAGRRAAWIDADGTRRWELELSEFTDGKQPAPSVGDIRFDGHATSIDADRRRIGSFWPGALGEGESGGGRSEGGQW